MWPRPSSDRLPQQPIRLKPHTWDHLIGGIYKNFRGMQRELIIEIASLIINQRELNIGSSDIC